MRTPAYNGTEAATHWHGLRLVDGASLASFLTSDVASRLHDEVGTTDLRSHLTGLASTGFAQTNLQAILDAELAEERDWAAGEALAEAWLSKEYGVVWPWNMERDKRTPLASLPGADLIGFDLSNGGARLALGEVKCSSDTSCPPNVMTGRSGMTKQLEALATDLSILFTLIRWLQARCKSGEAEKHFNAAITLLLESGNKAISLFGVLVRDTAPNEKDLLNRGKHLATLVNAPTSCRLIALYLPWAIATLPARADKGSAP